MISRRSLIGVAVAGAACATLPGTALATGSPRPGWTGDMTPPGMGAGRIALVNDEPWALWTGPGGRLVGRRHVHGEWRDLDTPDLPGVTTWCVHDGEPVLFVNERSAIRVNGVWRELPELPRTSPLTTLAYTARGTGNGRLLVGLHHFYQPRSVAEVESSLLLEWNGRDWRPTPFAHLDDLSGAHEIDVITGGDEGLWALMGLYYDHPVVMFERDGLWHRHGSELPVPLAAGDLAARGNQVWVLGRYWPRLLVACLDERGWTLEELPSALIEHGRISADGEVPTIIGSGANAPVVERRQGTWRPAATLDTPASFVPTALTAFSDGRLLVEGRCDGRTWVGWRLS